MVLLDTHTHTCPATDANLLAWSYLKGNASQRFRQFRPVLQARTYELYVPLTPLTRRPDG